jgi:phosphate starvation-inducible PhoH-like protein
MDAHLRTIETALQVKIAHRHEQFKVDGTKANAKRGMEMLQAMYEMAARPIEPAMVQLMLAGDADMDATDGPALKTKRSDLKPRTLNQATYLDQILSRCKKRLSAKRLKWPRWPSCAGARSTPPL